MKAILFPGQGSQRKGMGAGLFDEFKQMTSAADDILGYSIKELCLEDPLNQLGETNYTQPAIYVVNSLKWNRETLQAKNNADFFAGHSLGEYNALWASGVFDFETGLKLVKERSRLMALSTGGAMAAVIGLNEQAILGIFKDNQFSNIHIANYNTPVQIVISGARDEIKKAVPILRKQGAKLAKILLVSGAFHSNQMLDAKIQFEKFVNQYQFCNPKIPIISNVTAQEIHHKNIKKLMCEHLISPVRWVDSIKYLMGKGQMTFQEIGPGNILTNLVKEIKKEPFEIVDGDIKDTIRKKKSDCREIHKTIEGKTCGTAIGNLDFRQKFGLKYAYVAGGMYRGISSTDFVIALGKSGMLGFFGTGGLDLEEVEKAILEIKENSRKSSYGLNFLHHPMDPEYEENLTDVLLKHKVNIIEASAFMKVTPALVRYRLSGLKIKNGVIDITNRILGKISRPEIAEAFMRPAPEETVKMLRDSGRITKAQADCAGSIPMADALCVEADSGGHTDMGQAFAIFPAIRFLADRILEEQNYSHRIFIGTAGGIGTPEAAAAAFVLGADFILTGSINQCTVETKISNMVKDMLCQMNVQDTDYAPAGDMFEFGAKVQVLKKGTFFPARAKKLYNLYTSLNSIDSIDDQTKKQIEKYYFKQSFEQVYQDTKEFFAKRDSSQIEKAERDPKHKMALIFKWYFGHSSEMALKGSKEDKVNFQIHTGPALGAFNQWVKGTELEDWRNRYVDKIGVKLMDDTVDLLRKRIRTFQL